jgi:uncharacterized protein
MRLASYISILSIVFISAVHASPLPDFAFISVSGEAQLEVTPDKARIQLMIRHTANTADSATEAVYQQGRELLQFAAAQGVAETDIEAAQINKEAMYKDYNDRSITGYEASQPVSLTLNNLQNYVAIMDYLFKQPHIFSIQSSFDSSAREQHELNLSQQAGKDARRRAEHLAAAQGVKISSVFAVTDSAGWGSLAADFGFSGAAVSYGMLRKPSAMEMDSSGPSLVLPRHIKLQKSVNVIYKITP